MTNGSAYAAIDDAVAWVVQQNLTGMNSDTEFSGNASMAAPMARFMANMTAALAAHGKEMLWYSGGWGGIKYYEEMAASGAYAVDGSLYYMNGTGSSSARPNSRQIEHLLHFMPPTQFSVAVGGSLPPEHRTARCNVNGPYGTVYFDVSAMVTSLLMSSC
jgi:hypothetical protein